MIDQPPVADLAQAVGRWLDQIVATDPNEPLDDGDRYGSRIAANLSRIIARQVHHGPEQEAATSAQLGALLETLGVRIGDSESEPTLATMAAALDQHLQQKLFAALSDPLDNNAPSPGNDPWVSQAEQRLVHRCLADDVGRRVELARPGYGPAPLPADS